MTIRLDEFEVMEMVLRFMRSEGRLVADTLYRIEFEQDYDGNITAVITPLPEKEGEHNGDT